MPRADRTPTRPRWRKLLADAGNERGRLAAMIVAVAVSLAALGTILGGWAVLTREIAVNYLGTAPAEASLELPGGADPALVQRVRELAAVAEADAREVVLARVRVAVVLAFQHHVFERNPVTFADRKALAGLDDLRDPVLAVDGNQRAALLIGRCVQ